MVRPRQPRTTFALFASLAFVAVMMGLLAGRACDPEPRPPRPRAPPTAPAASAPHAIDTQAPLTTLYVDAGVLEPSIALVPLGNPTKRSPRARPDRDVDSAVAPTPRVALAPPPPPPSAPADAGAAFIDAGVAVASADAAVARNPNAPADAMPSAPLVVVYDDALSWLKLVEMRVYLDGKRVVDEKPTDARRPPRGERTLLTTRVFPGHHQLRIETTYVGDGGIFNYMESVRVKMREMAVVEVDAADGARVVARAFDRGALEPWEKRPGLRFEVP